MGSLHCVNLALFENIYNDIPIFKLLAFYTGNTYNETPVLQNYRGFPLKLFEMKLQNKLTNNAAAKLAKCKLVQIFTH